MPHLGTRILGIHTTNAALFDATADVEWLRGAVIAPRCSVHVGDEVLDHVLQLN